jgi:hypothetical protein
MLELQLDARNKTQFECCICAGFSSSLSRFCIEGPVVTGGPLVQIAFSIGGGVSTTEITLEIQQKFITAIANSLVILKDLVQILSSRNAQRRLLAVDLVFQVLAVDADDAAVLHMCITDILFYCFLTTFLLHTYRLP